MKQHKLFGHISIKWSIFLGCLLLCGIVLVFLWIFQTCLLDSFHRSVKEGQIRSAAETISSHLEQDDLEAVVSDIALNQQICVVITDESGYVLLSEEYQPRCVIHQQNSLFYLQLLYLTMENGGIYSVSGKNISSGILVDQRNQKQMESFPETMVYATTVNSESGGVRLITLCTDLEPVTSAEETLRLQLIWVTGIMVGLALLLALILSLLISRPIRRVNQNAGKLAKGDYSVEFQENSYREIQELSQTLNYAAQELSKVENLQRELVANISHDLRTPLTMIIGYAEVMRDLPGESTPENLQVIIDEATRMTTLVSDVLDISKIQSGTVVLKITEFSLTDSVREMMERYQKMSDYRITFQYQENVLVRGDALRISQVIYNLVNNAITYTGADKQVRLYQQTRGNRVRIIVEDTGDGIPPDRLKDIWERYYKVDQEHKRAQIGTGLGLSIVKSILDLHEGTSYGVQSEIGRGSRFWFEMEIQACDPVEENEEIPKEDPSGGA